MKENNEPRVALRIEDFADEINARLVIIRHPNMAGQVTYTCEFEGGHLFDQVTLNQTHAENSKGFGTSYIQAVKDFAEKIRGQRLVIREQKKSLGSEEPVLLETVVPTNLVG